MKHYEMNFNDEKAIVYEHDDRRVEVCAEKLFETTDAVYDAIDFLVKKRVPLKFELLVELFAENLLINEGFIGEIDYGFLKFYCTSDPHVKVAWVEVNSEGVLEIVMTTV